MHCGENVTAFAQWKVFSLGEYYQSQFVRETRMRLEESDERRRLVVSGPEGQRLSLSF